MTDGEKMLWVAEYTRVRAESMRLAIYGGQSLMDDETMSGIIGGAVEAATAAVRELRDELHKIREGYGWHSDQFQMAAAVVMGVAMTNATPCPVCDGKRYVQLYGFNCAGEPAPRGGVACGFCAPRSAPVPAEYRDPRTAADARALVSVEQQGDESRHRARPATTITRSQCRAADRVACCICAGATTTCRASATMRAEFRTASGVTAIFARPSGHGQETANAEDIPSELRNDGRRGRDQSRTRRRRRVPLRPRHGSRAGLPARAQSR